jgi:uncharacterized oxidoreductase
MQLSGNTILITGGGSGIGRGLAEAFHTRGNQVIIAGRRQSVLDEVISANPGMASLILDVEEPQGIRTLVKEAVARFPQLNVLVNNAGIMRRENFLAPDIDIVDAEATVTTNLLGPIRLTAALLPQLKAMPRSAILTVSSGLAFVPLADTPTYCATKAAIHSYSQSLRSQLRHTSVQVIELIPPYVQTPLMGLQQLSDPNAMPLRDFISESMVILKASPEATEVCVDRVTPLRFAARDGHYDAFYKSFNDKPAGEP